MYYLREIISAAIARATLATIVLLGGISAAVLRIGRRRGLLATIVLLGGIAAPGLAMLSSRPSRVDLLMTPGARRQFEISVSNDSQDSLSCEVNVRNFAMEPNGLPHGTSDPSPRSLVSWVKVVPAKFTLAGGAAQKIMVSLDVPRTASGGYYATVEALGQPAAKAPSAPGEANIQFSFQANTIVLGVVKGRGVKPELALKEMAMKRAMPGGRNAGTWSLSALVEDTGNVHTVVTGTAEIKNAAGARIWKGPLLGGKGNLIPGFPRYFIASGINSLPDGRYIATVDVRAAGRRLAMRAAQGFEVSGGKATPADASGPLWATSGGLTASPSEVLISGPARARRIALVSLTNTLTKRISCTLSVSPWRVTRDGMGGPCAAPDALHNAAGCVTVQPDTVDLAPGSTQRVRVVASIPEDAQGENYAGIIVTPAPQDAQGILPPSVMVTVSRDNTGEAAVAVKAAKVEAAKPAGYRISATVQNTGNARTVPDVRAEVLDAKGMRMGDPLPIPGDGSALLPGVVRSYTAPWGQSLPPGHYSLRIIAGADQNKPGTKLTARFSIPLPGARASAARPGAVRAGAARTKPAYPARKIAARR